jgi:crotonobetainyl-CoA:carnitine CoA-transferase CaiB-like acyl-CoA transferase
MDKALKGVRILSLALNLPGPAALMRCQSMGARCTKLEPPPSNATATSGDPMAAYNPQAYQTMHAGVRTIVADLKSETGQRSLHKALTKTDVLLTSFRPSALVKLGLAWKQLHDQYPALSLVQIVGATGSQAEEPGHDLTYLAANDLITGLDLPPTLYADMGGSLIASEAVLKAHLHFLRTGRGSLQEVALADAAAYLALPRHWGLTRADGTVGGAHAGYRVYACKNGRVALAALEPHFARVLGALAGLEMTSGATMLDTAAHQTIERFMASKTRRQLDVLATQHDIPLHTLA